MEQAEIDKRNLAIAAYMGIEVNHGTYKTGEPKFQVAVTKSSYLKGIGLGFNYDWSWLMPVVEMITQTHSSDLVIEHYSDYFQVSFLTDEINSTRASSNSCIEAVWKAVSDFCLTSQP